MIKAWASGGMRPSLDSSAARECEAWPSSESAERGEPAISDMELIAAFDPHWRWRRVTAREGIITFTMEEAWIGSEGR